MSDDSADGGRHLQVETLDRYWTSDVPVEIPILGTPRCHLQIDPHHGELCLLTQASGLEPDVSRFRNIAVRTIVRDAAKWTQLVVKVQGALRAPHALLTSIADRMQLDRQPLAVAVAAALDEHRGVLASRSGLSTEQEIGLFGEVLVLEHLVSAVGPGPAMESWTGPFNEEHDFCLENCHLEVKTTSTELRRHLIGSIRQLDPLRGAPLWFVSIQLTRATAQGRTLPKLIEDVRIAAGEYRVEFDDRLQGRWDDNTTDLYPVAWTLRNEPRCFEVNTEFPRITQAVIDDNVLGSSFISDISFRVNVAQLAYGRAPAPIASFVEIQGDKG